MATSCTAEQLADALTLWSVEVGGSPVFCREREDADNLKSLDLFLSTTEVFRDGFEGKFENAFDEHKRKFQFSKQNFIDYLKPRCLLLARNNYCFDLVLTCAFVSSAILRPRCNDCFHLSRVACKLLTTILEDKFSEMFTDSGWETLMDYCREIHDAVYPSKENRHPSYGSYSEEDEVTDLKELDSDEKSEVKLVKQDLLETNEDPETKFLGQPVSNKMEERESMDTDVIEEASDSESLDDDLPYWDYETLNTWQICRRILDNRKFLMDVLDLLNTFVQNIDPEETSNKYDIELSDDEDLEKLERRERFNLAESGYNINFSDDVVKYLTNKIYEEKNEVGNSSQEEVRSEDVTDDELFHRFAEMFGPSDDEPRCEVCAGRSVSFKKNWLGSYCKKYSNCDLVSNFLKVEDLLELNFMKENDDSSQ